MRTHYQRSRQLRSAQDSSILDPLSEYTIALNPDSIDIPVSPTHPPSIVTLQVIRLSLSITASANFAGLFGTTLSSDYEYFVINFKVSTPKMVKSNRLKSAHSVAGAYMNCGMSYLKFESDSQLNLGGATASLSANGESFDGRVESMALQDVNGVEDLVRQGFNMSSMEALGVELPKPVAWVTTPAFDTLAEIETLVEEEESFQEIVRVCSLSYGLRSIWFRRTFNTAKENFGGIAQRANPTKKRFLECVDFSLVRVVYAAFGLDENATPNGTQANDANRIWNTSTLSSEAIELGPVRSNLAQWAPTLDYSVSPYLIPTASGEDYYISSLLPLAPPGNILASKDKPTGIPYRFTESSGSSAEIAMNAGFGDMVEVSTGLNVVYAIGGSMNLWNVPGHPDSIVTTEAHGRGFRMCVKYISVTASASVTLPGIAINTELGLGHSTFAIQVIGIEANQLDGLADLVAASSGPFDAKALQIYGQVSSKLAEKLEGEPTGTECLVSVVIDLTHPAISNFADLMPEYMYAVSCIYYGKSYNMAVENITDDAAKYRIETFYRTLGRIEKPLGTDPFNPESTPTQVLRDYTWEIYYLADS